MSAETKKETEPTEQPEAQQPPANPQPAAIKYVGLGNQGATCYMNSFLQMMFMIPEFRHEMLQWKYDPDLHGPAIDFIPFQLQKLFAKMQMRDIDFVETKGLTRSFKWDREDSFTQHDVQEFSKILFEALEVSFAATESYDTVDQLFQGESLNYIECKNAGCDSSNLEKWLDLQMVIENQWEQISNDRIEKSLQTYLKPEHLTKEGGNQYDCSKCEKKVDAQKGVRFLKLPKVLSLNINRFTFDAMSGNRIKLSNFVSFPFILNMNDYINGYEGIKNKYDLTSKFDEDGGKPNSSTVSNPSPTEASLPTEPAKTTKNKKFANVQSSNKTKAFLQEMKKKAKQDQFADVDFGCVVEEKPRDKESQSSIKKDDTALAEIASTSGSNAGGISQQSETGLGDLLLSSNNIKSGEGVDFDIQEGKYHRKRSQSLTEELGLKGKVQSVDSTIATDESNISHQAPGGIPPPPDLDTLRYIMAIPDTDAKIYPSLASKYTTADPERPAPVVTNMTNTATKATQGTQSENISPQKKPARPEAIEKRIKEIVEADEEKLIEEYMKEGPMVYRLVGVLVHRGGAYGGHYYAFIRSFEDDQWHEFNDSNVTSINKRSVAERSFGGKGTSENGYMLFYQLIEDCHRPEGFLTIPKELSSLCKAELDKEREEISKMFSKMVSHEITDNKYKIKVYYKTDMKVIEAETKIKLKDFLQLVKKQLKFDDEKDSNLRLRVYKPAEDVMGETFTGMDDREVLYLGITPAKCYCIERKADGEEFREYDPLLIKVKCYLYEDGVVSSDSANCTNFYISISKARPIQDFEQLIRKHLNIPEGEYFYIFKRRVISDSLKEAVLLNSGDNLLYSLDEMKVYEASKVLVERIPQEKRIDRPVLLENFKEEDSKWVQLVEKENYTLLIRFNLPSLTPNSELTHFDQELLIDSRLTLGELKKMISESMEVEEDKFVMRRGGKVGLEMSDLSKTLLKCGLLNGSTVYTAFGTPTKPGELLIRILTTIKTDEELAHSYNLKPLTEMAVDQNCTADEAIAKAVEIYKKAEGADLDGMTFRLREKHSRSLTKVYRNISLKKQGVCEGKQLVLENINPTVQIATLDAKQFLLVVQILNPEKLEFEEIFELALDKNDSLATIAQKVHERVPTIPLEFMSAAKVSTVWGLDVYFGITLPYFALNDPKNLMTGQPFYIGTDGVVLLVVDSRKKFRELTPAEKNSLKGRSQFTEDHYDFTALNISRVKVKPKEKVMKIYATQHQKEMDQTRMKEREEEEKKKQKQDSAAPKPQPISSVSTPSEPKEDEYADYNMESLF